MRRSPRLLVRVVQVASPAARDARRRVADLLLRAAKVRGDAPATASDGPAPADPPDPTVI